jgi:hypothetical protein
MTLTSTLFRSIGAALLAALSLATATASADPGFSVGSGCAAQCIEKAIVSVTASSAKVVLKTKVLAHLKVSITPQGPSGTPGGLAANLTRTVSISAFSPIKIAKFSNLKPDTTYSIVVWATDLQGRKASQQGTFKTRPVQTTGQAGGIGGLSSGAGCAAECIQKALFTQSKPAASIANAEFRTAVDARIHVSLSRDADGHDVVSTQQSAGYVRSWHTQFGGLDYGRRYHVVVRATDREGRQSIRSGSFKTVPASVLVTIHKIKVLSDGDKHGKGELYFGYWGGRKALGAQGFQKIKSGSVVAAKLNGAGRPGVYYRTSANGNPELRIFVNAQECDAVLMKNCLVEASAPEAVHDARAGGAFSLSQLLGGGALPGWYGTGVQQPAGHDAYVVFSTTQHYVKFLVLATVDVDVDWP